MAAVCELLDDATAAEAALPALTWADAAEAAAAFALDVAVVTAEVTATAADVAVDADDAA